jgi:ribose transport system substrate-binding protein
MKKGLKLFGWAMLAMLLCTVLIVPACKKKSGKKVIGVSLLKENDEFYMTLKKGLKETADKMGYDIVILSADFDLNKQSNNVDTLLLKKMSALVICPVNSKGVGPIIQKVTDKNIPVFTADLAADQGKVVAHIASDNELGGKLAAEKMLKLVQKGGTVAIIMQPGTESVRLRVKGFRDTAEAGGLVVLEDINGYDDAVKTASAVSSALSANPGIAGFFAANDNMASGVEKAIAGSNNSSIVLIGYDAAKVAIEKIKAGGAWKADVAQNPYEIGKVTIETIDKYLNGKLEKSDATIKIPVPVNLVDAKTLK